MGAKSKRKGATFELKIAEMFTEAFGKEFRRTPLSGGWAKGTDEVAGDLVCVNDLDFPYSIECKKAEGWFLDSLFTDQHAWFDAWWTQAVAECPDGKSPLLVFSRNRMPTYVASYADVLGKAGFPAMILVIGDEPICVTLLRMFLNQVFYG